MNNQDEYEQFKQTFLLLTSISNHKDQSEDLSVIDMNKLTDILALNGYKEETLKALLSNIEQGPVYKIKPIHKISNDIH